MIGAAMLVVGSAVAWVVALLVAGWTLVYGPAGAWRLAFGIGPYEATQRRHAPAPYVLAAIVVACLAASSTVSSPGGGG